MRLDPSRSAIDNFVTQIRLTNPSSTLTKEQFTIGELLPYDPGNPQDTRQTQADLTGIHGTGKHGVKRVIWARLTMISAQPAGAPVTRIQIEAADSDAVISGKVIQAMNLIAEEILTTDLIRPADASSLGFLTVTPKPGSIAYTGPDYVMQLTLPGFTDVPLEEDITTGTLTGFDAA